VRVDGGIDGLLHQRQLARRFNRAQRADGGGNVLEGSLRRQIFHPLRPIGGVRVAFVVRARQFGVDFRIIFCQRGERVPQLRKCLDASEARFFLDARIVRPVARAAPALLLRRFGQQQKRGAFFVVAREVIEIFFLHENVRRVRFLVARVAEQHDGSADRGNQPGATLGKHAQRLALPGPQDRGESRHEQKGKHAAPDRASSLHRATSRKYPGEIFHHTI
jgi:hypothetical protein